jgi:N6-adenosine-specific RNA methylase IME4
MSADLFGDASIAAPSKAGHYQTVYADPPWKEAGGGQIQRGANRHYPLMKTRDICALPVRLWAAPNAHLYLWTTNNFLEDGLEVVEAWGFRYVTMITWFKSRVVYLDVEPTNADLQMGIGQYYRGCTEHCLFAVRGSLPYRVKGDGKRAQGLTGFHAPRMEHSVKPDQMRAWIEQVSHGPYLELFARQPAAGWDVWGNEATGERLSA